MFKLIQEAKVMTLLARGLHLFLAPEALVVPALVQSRLPFLPAGTGIGNFSGLPSWPHSVNLHFAQGESQSKTSRAPLQVVTMDDIHKLYEATRGTPEANQLQDIAEIYDASDKDFVTAAKIISEVLSRYERRHLRVLRSKEAKDEKRKKKAETTLAIFADVLERLQPMIRVQIAREAKRRAAEPDRPSPIDRLNEASANKSSDESASESSDNSETLTGISLEVQELIGDFGSVSREVGRTRLVQDERIIVDVGAIAGAISSAGREFRHGKPAEAIKQAKQLDGAFKNKIRQWEARAQTKEKQRHKLSMNKRQKMEAEHNIVRVQCQLALKQFQRLLRALDQYDMG
jgi:hypothetical protein